MAFSRRSAVVACLLDAMLVKQVAAQCGPGGIMPYPPGCSCCPTSPTSGCPAQCSDAPAPGPAPSPAPGPSPTPGDSSHDCPLLGDVGLTTASGTDARTGNNFFPGENIYGPFEAGFSTQQDFILQGLGCPNDGSDGHVAGGIDTHTAEQMVAYQCNIVLPRIDENNDYISLIDECGGHTNEYHFHERLACLYAESGTHSAKVGQGNDGSSLYGKWENFQQTQLPLLDACGGHYGPTPDSTSGNVYHYHVQDSPPFTYGCFGPNDDGSLVTVQQCRDFYSGCDGALADITTPAGTYQYDAWCPCWDAAGLNTGVDIQELPVFGGTVTTTTTTTTTTTVTTSQEQCADDIRSARRRFHKHDCSEKTRLCGIAGSSRRRVAGLIVKNFCQATCEFCSPGGRRLDRLVFAKDEDGTLNEGGESIDDDIFV